MDDEGIEKINTAIKSLERKVDRLMHHFERFEYYCFREGFPFRHPDYFERSQEFKADSMERWIERNERTIKYTDDILRKHDLSRETANFLCCYENLNLTSNLSSRVLLGSCGCGGQLQLFVNDNILHLTCPKCGRWIWQGLKHE
jgi:hypothetical protein